MGICATANAQQKPPCVDADDRASKAELRASMDRIEAKLKEKTLQQELDREKGGRSTAEQQLGVEQKHSASLASANQTATQRIAELERQIAEREKTIFTQKQTIATATGERDKALNEARYARKWSVSLARVFGTKKKARP
jgi:chromosome segregation ATPase